MKTSSLARYRSYTVGGKNVGNDDEMYENGDRAERNVVMNMKWMKSKPPLVSVKARSLLAQLIEV